MRRLARQPVRRFWHRLTLGLACPPRTPAVRDSSGAQEEEDEGQEAQIEERRLMHVDWAALGVVAVVSIAASVIFTILLATGTLGST